MNRVAIDTNLWLYLFLQGQDEVKAERIRSKLTGVGRPVISSQVIVECVANLIRQANIPFCRIQVHVDDLLKLCDLQDRDVAVIECAMRLMKSGSWSWWDSLIVAAALKADCDELWTEDMQHGRLVDNRLRIVNPFVQEELS